MINKTYEIRKEKYIKYEKAKKIESIFKLCGKVHAVTGKISHVFYLKVSAATEGSRIEVEAILHRSLTWK